MSNDQDSKKSNGKHNPYLRYGGMVFQMLTVILLSAWGGSWLDGHFQTEKPFWTLGCAFAGVILSMVLIIKDINRPTMNTALFGRYMLWLTLLTALLFALVYLLIGKFSAFFTIPVPYIGLYLLSFYAVSIASGYLVIRSGGARGAVQIRSVMGSMIIKFFLYIIVLSVFLISTEGRTKEIATYFSMFYVTFTVFEKTFLISSLSSTEKTDETSGDQIKK